MDEVKAVEIPVTAAPQVGVETTPQAPTATEVDLATELEAVRIERDNYKRGLLKAKGKVEEIPNDPQELEDVVSRKVQEALHDAKAQELEAREKALVAQLVKENRELKLATQNRSQLGVSTGTGASTETPPAKDNYFTDEQLAALKARGLDPEKVKANIRKFGR